LENLPAEVRFALQQLIGKTYTAEERRAIREANTADAETRTRIYAEAVPYLAEAYALKAVKVALRTVADRIAETHGVFADDAKAVSVGQPFRMSDDQKAVAKALLAKAPGSGKNDKVIVREPYATLAEATVSAAIESLAQRLLEDGMRNAAVAADDDDD
jgi:hypothetical protein